MSEIVEKIVKNIIDIIPISSKIKSESLLKNGKFPVYSSEKLNNGIKGYTNQPTYNKEKGTYIVFGDHTRSINIVNIPFSVMDNVKILKIKKDLKIDEYYLKYMWEKTIPNLGYARHWKVAKESIVPIPINQNGDYDLEKQKEIAFKYKEIEEKKNLLLRKIEYLKKIKIDILQNSYNYAEIPITKLFSPKGGCMKLSKEYCKINAGTFPVYSGSKNFETFGNINSYDYDGEYLTWIIDGLAGYIMHIDGKFSITCHRGILIPTTNCKNIDLHYIKYMIEPIFRERKRGRIGVNGKNEYTALKPSHINSYNDVVKIPIKDDGSFDLDKQKEIAQKYATIESIKEDLYNKVLELTKIEVT